MLLRYNKDTKIRMMKSELRNWSKKTAKRWVGGGQESKLFSENFLQSYYGIFSHSTYIFYISYKFF